MAVTSEENQEQTTVSYTTIVTEETDSSPEIKTACINGEDYKFDYESLKNKPCYQTRKPGPMMVSETDLAFAPNETATISVYVSTLEVPEGIVSGDWYRVTWDGISYDCEGMEYAATETTKIAYIGNLAIMGGQSGSDLPFFLMKEGPMLGFITTQEGETHRVSVRHLISETKLISRALLPKVYFHGTTPMETGAALNKASARFSFEMTLEANSWVKRTNNVLSYNFTRALDDYCNSHKKWPMIGEDPITICALSTGFTDEEAAAFAALKFLPCPWPCFLYAVGDFPSVDIPVVIFMLGTEAPDFTDEKTETPADPKPEEDNGDNTNGS